MRNKMNKNNYNNINNKAFNNNNNKTYNSLIMDKIMMKILSWMKMEKRRQNLFGFGRMAFHHQCEPKLKMHQPNNWTTINSKIITRNK